MAGLLWTLAIIAFSFSTASARTYYVSVYGTGDAPTIAAALDSAAAGDTVLVGPGTHAVYGLLMKDGVVLTSEMGPTETKLVEPPSVQLQTLIETRRCVDPATEISGFWIEGYGFAGPGIAAIDVLSCIGLFIHGNIFVANEIGVTVNNSAVTIEHNTFAHNGTAITGDGLIRYNIIGDPFIAGGIGPCNALLPGSPGGIINFYLDPLFCGGADSTTAYYLQSDSPCAPGNDPLDGSCGLIGALPVGCQLTPVERSTWGRIKSLFSD